MPGRHLSNTETRLKDLWAANFGPSLRSLEISNAALRGLTNATVDFRYPLTVLAGKNGVGKSTILACAACAYQNTNAFAAFFSARPYFNFTDFFISGWGEVPIQNVKIKWTYRLPDRTVKISEADKGPSRWRGYQKRPDRVVDFVGTIRALHPSELRVLRSHFGGNGALVPASLDAPHRTSVSQILARNYQDVQVATSGRYTLHHLRSQDGIQYSAFNAGSGEDIACCLSRIVNRVPDRAMIVIEEIETGLHPAAQRNLMRQLIELCWSRKIQIICSSHSAAVLESVPSEARVLLVRHGETLQPRYEVTVAEAVSDLLEAPVNELAVCVEDEVARAIVQESLSASLRTRVRIVSCGAWQDVLRHLAAFQKDPAIGQAIGVLDGDRTAGAAEHETLFSSFLGGGITEEQKQWLTDRICFLPGGVPPEQWIWQLGQDVPFREAIASEVNADVNALVAFFAAPPPPNHHGIPYLLSQRIGTDELRALTALASATVSTRPGDFAPITALLQARLGLMG